MHHLYHCVVVRLFPASFLDFHPSEPLSLHLLRQKVTPDGKHLAGHAGRKAIHLSRILLHLPRIQHALQPRRLRRQLE